MCIHPRTTYTEEAILLACCLKAKIIIPLKKNNPFQPLLCAREPRVYLSLSDLFLGRTLGSFFATFLQCLIASRASQGFQRPEGIGN